MKKVGFGIVFVVLLLLAFAVFLTLDAFGVPYVDNGLIIPIGVAILGISFLIKRGARLLGIIFTLGGIYLILRELDMMTPVVSKLALPVVLVLIAAYILASALNPRRHINAGPQTDKARAADDSPRGGEPGREYAGGNSDISDSPDYNAVFAGHMMINHSQSLRSCTSAAIFGELRVDFSNAAPAAGGAYISAFAMFGSEIVIVPEGWNVSVIGTPILGSVDDVRLNKSYVPDRPSVEIRATAVLGGIKIRN